MFNAKQRQLLYFTKTFLNFGTTLSRPITKLAIWLILANQMVLK